MTAIPFPHVPLSFGGLHQAPLDGVAFDIMDDPLNRGAQASSSSSQLPHPPHPSLAHHSAPFSASPVGADLSSSSAAHHPVQTSFAALTSASNEILARRPHASRAATWQPSSVPNSLAMESSASAWGLHPMSSSSYAVTGSVDFLPQSAPSTVWNPGMFGALEGDRHQSFAISSGDYGIAVDPRSQSYEVPFDWSPPPAAAEYSSDLLVPRQSFIPPQMDLGVPNPFDPSRAPQNLPALQIPRQATGPAQPLSAGSSLSPTSHFSPGLVSTELEPSTLGVVREDTGSPYRDGASSTSASPTNPHAVATAGGPPTSDSSAGGLRVGHMDQFSIWPPGQRPPIIKEETRPPKPVTDPELRKYRCDLCGKAFKRSGTFNQHKRTHTGERPHVCPMAGCGKAFQTTSNLKRHIRTHRERAPPSASSSKGEPSSSSSRRLPRDQ